MCVSIRICYVIFVYFPFSINSFFLRSPQNPPSLKPTTHYSYVHLYFTYTSLSNNCNNQQTNWKTKNSLPGGLPPPNGWGAGNDSPCSGPFGRWNGWIRFGGSKRRWSGPGASPRWDLCVYSKWWTRWSWTTWCWEVTWCRDSLPVTDPCWYIYLHLP